MVLLVLHRLAASLALESRQCQRAANTAKHQPGDVSEPAASAQYCIKKIKGGPTHLKELRSRVHSQTQVEGLFRAIGVYYLLLAHYSANTELKRIIPLVSEALAPLAARSFTLRVQRSGCGDSKVA